MTAESRGLPSIAVGHRVLPGLRGVSAAGERVARGGGTRDARGERGSTRVERQVLTGANRCRLAHRCCFPLSARDADASRLPVASECGNWPRARWRPAQPLAGARDARFRALAVRPRAAAPRAHRRCARRLLFALRISENLLLLVLFSKIPRECLQRKIITAAILKTYEYSIRVHVCFAFSSMRFV